MKPVLQAVADQQFFIEVVQAATVQIASGAARSLRIPSGWDGELGPKSERYRGASAEQ